MLGLPDPRIDRLRAVILVKGDSDRSALQTLAARQGRDLVAEQLHRFVGTRVGRRSRYAQLLVQAVDLRRVPRPLAEVLRRV